MSDIVVVNPENDYHVSLSNGNGFTNFIIANHDENLGLNQWKIADFNGDGKDDIIVANNENSYSVSLFAGDKFVTSEWLNHGGTLHDHEWKIADFNGDGKDDIVVANPENDYHVSTIKYYESNDTLYGGDGDDNLNGGRGLDILNGGSGADSFDFSSLEDSSINVMDEIEDFEQGVDKINFSEIEEDLSFDSFEFVVENGHTIIKDKNSDFAINLQGEFNLTEDDFNF